MPTIRYQLSNEFKLGNPELYRASSNDEPEALLEGVAMAGLVGLLKQLGDLAEFASEIFHDLHKDMMATARRGNVLKLRVQQIEAEFPSIEKSFLCHSNQTHFLYDTGISWHTKLHMDENLIIREGIPKFVADSYEECRGPPDLSTLDRFDAAGSGACLKRYSDPSCFRTTLVEREKIVHENKKKGLCWRNGETAGIVVEPDVNSKLQFMASKVASEELPVTHVKLKRHLFESDTGYAERLYQVLSPEESIVSESSKSTQREESIAPESSKNTHRESKPIASGKSISEVQLILSDASSDIETNPSQSPIAEEVTEYEISSEGSSDDCSSDDITNDMENYLDAHNTLESEVETESEYNVKLNLDFRTVTHGMNSGTKFEVELNSLQNSHSSGKCTPKASPVRPASGYREEFSTCSITDSTSSLKHSYSCGVVKDSEVKLSCTLENSTICSETKNSAISSDTSSHVATLENSHFDEYAGELDLKDTIVEFDRQDEALPSSSNLLVGKFNESTKQIMEAFQDEIYLRKSSIAMESHELLEETEILGAPEDNLAYSRVEFTLENTNFEPLCDAKDPQESYKLDQNGPDIIEKTVPMNMTRIDEVCTPHVSLSIVVDTQSIADARLFNDLCHTIPNSIQEDGMDRSEIGEDSSSETSPCHCQEGEIEDIVPIEESSELQCGSIPNLISFEKYLSLQNSAMQIRPIDNTAKSDSTCEPDSNVSSNNVSFTEFLKLTQMDWLLNIEKQVTVDPLRNENGYSSKTPTQFSQNAKEGLSMSSGFLAETQNTLEEAFGETPPLPPLPPLEWRMGKTKMGHPNSPPNVYQSSVGKNLFTAISTMDKKPSHDLLAARCATIEESNPLEPLVEIEDESSLYNSVSNEGDSMESIMLPHTPPDINMHPSNPFSSSACESLEQSLPVSIQTLENGRPEVDQLSNPDNLITQMVNDEQLHLVPRLRDPLIEEVASHDKSMLRKVKEPAHPSTTSKNEEHNTLLEQIRNKSQLSKPIGGAKPNMRGAPTILNVAILEKAISIRQACIGSDDEDDDDGDSWSDS